MYPLCTPSWDNATFFVQSLYRKTRLRENGKLSTQRVFQKAKSKMRGNHAILISATFPT